MNQAQVLSVPPHQDSPATTAVIGMLIFLVTEAMMFGSLVAGYWYLRVQSAVWLPPGISKLPVGITTFNTLVLLSSSVTMHRALASVRTGRGKRVALYLGLSAFFGVIFLSLQASEWASLIREGLNLRTTYGSSFFTATGVHGLHVLAGVVCILVLFFKSLRGRYTSQQHIPMTLCEMYWHFVDGVWLVLFVSLYLAQ